VFNDGACRLLDPCRSGLVRIGNECVGPRPDHKPPIVVNNDPCATLSGAEFQRCIRGTPHIPVDPKPPIKGPVTGGGDVRPGGNLGVGSTSHNPVGGTVGVVKPNGIFHPTGPRIDGPKNHP
jgi:hypothetical protein